MEVAVLQKVWDLCPESVHRVLAKCLETGSFPKIEKLGELCLLKKSPEAPSFNPSSYRPICLLPILGKVLKKVIARWVREVHNSAGLDAPNQCGFKKGLSSVDAVRRVVSLARGNIKYIAGIYVDFTGTFDTLWWPSILARLRLINCPANLFALIVDYLTDREVMIKTSHQRGEAGLSAGIRTGPPVLEPRDGRVLNSGVTIYGGQNSLCRRPGNNSSGKQRT
jgi:hypothetical protein